jgi:hypothetical protein
MAELADFEFSTIPEKGQSSRGRCSQTGAKIKLPYRSFWHTILLNNILKFDDHRIKNEGGDRISRGRSLFYHFPEKVHSMTFDP